MNILFICNMNQHRSKTAELLFKGSRSAGLYGGTILAKEHLTWADVVVVMTDEQRREIARRFPKEYLQKKILNFDIPDIYSFNQRELRELLKEKYNILLQPELVS